MRVATTAALAGLLAGGCARVELEERTPSVERLQAVGALQRVHLFWDAVPGATAYTISDSTDPDFETADEYTSQESTSVAIGGIEDETVRWYFVQAHIGNRDTEPVSISSAAIAEASLTPATTLPAPVFGTGAFGIGSSVTVADLDGNGAGDLVAGCAACNGEEGAVYVLLNTGGSLSFTASRELDRIGGETGLGTAVALLDMDGDGDREVAAGAPYRAVPSTGGGATLLYDGTPLGPERNSGPVLFEADAAFQYVGQSLASGDFDADGYEDLAIGVPLADSSAGRVRLFYGGPEGMEDGGEISGLGDLSLGAQSFFGWSLSAGDVDGNGFDDLLVGAPGDGGTGSAHFFEGETTGLEVSSRISVLGSTNSDFGQLVAFGADEDGDGDLSKAVVKGAPGEPPTLEVYGGQDEDWELAWSLAGTTNVLSGLTAGFAVAGGDFDGDGFDELVVGEPSHDPASVGVDEGGRILVFAGGSGADPDSPVLVFEGADGERAGRSIAVADMDGDGMAEIVAGGGNSVRIFRGERHEGPRVDAGTVLHVERGRLQGTQGAGFVDTLDPDGDHTCTIDWGDGSSTETLAPCEPANIPGEHTWSERGTFLLRIRVEAADGRFGEALTTVYVK